MDFTAALLQRLEEDSTQQQQQSLAQLVEAAYEATLKPWHGWISSAACKVGATTPPRILFCGRAGAVLCCAMLVLNGLR
jgi:hypothetical protein